MLFNSLTYLLFLPLVVLLYWQLPQRGKLWLIFTASCVFYGFWRFDFLPLLLFSALLDYYLANLISRAEDDARRKRLLIVSIAANLLILGFFKYLVFFTQSAWSLAQLLGYEPGVVEMKIILPLGISFYIFATISYVVDVYRREFPAEKDLLTYCCFVVFFPHLVAGPILRASSLIPQLKQPDALSSTLVGDGISRIVAGLFLKVCLADPIGAMVDADFLRDASTLSALDVWTLTFLFGFQIYFDFAGYSHIAIGSSKLMGIHLPENFNFPYFATSPRDFWRRWHISLSTWIRDYLYLPAAGAYRPHTLRGTDGAPLPGLPESMTQKTLALYFTWAIMGLWHGANWTFVVWGLFHALATHVQRLWSGVFKGIQLPPLPTLLIGWLFTLAVSMAAWIPFRAQTLQQTFEMWKTLLDPTAYFQLGLILDRYTTAAGVFLLMCAAYIADRWGKLRFLQNPAVSFVGSALYYSAAIAAVLVFLQVRTQFIYFQF